MKAQLPNQLAQTSSLGAGHFKITAAPGVTFPNASKPFTAVEIGMEILAGTGSRNTFELIKYFDLDGNEIAGPAPEVVLMQ